MKNKKYIAGVLASPGLHAVQVPSAEARRQF